MFHFMGRILSRKERDEEAVRYHKSSLKLRVRDRVRTATPRSSPILKIVCWNFLVEHKYAKALSTEHLETLRRKASTYSDK